jgi:DNA-binding transcriptional LysR family regulator
MRQTALLLAIAETGTLGAAAKQLGMTQPAATKMLHELENTLGTKLFDRVGRKIQINEAGHNACLSFRGMQGTLKKLQRELAQMLEGSAGPVRCASLAQAAIPGSERKDRGWHPRPAYATVG